MNEAGALAAWSARIGADHVITDELLLARAREATFAHDRSVVAVLRPADARAVSECLRIASACEVPVHPVSRGRNWGLGSRAPWARRAALLELDRMDAITRFSERNATIAVEPGVTFRQVDAFLRGRNSALFLPAIGGSPEASVIGNALERGHGIGPGSRRADSIGAVQAILADGSYVSSGFAPGEIFDGGEAHRHGSGPSTNGLFQQGAPCVVTNMVLTLERRPALLAPFSADVTDLGALLEMLPPLLMEGAFGRHVLTVWNRAKFLACSHDYPWRAMRGETPLDLAKLGMADGWMISGASYAASFAHLRAAREALSGLAPAVTNLRVHDPIARDDESPNPFTGSPDDKNSRSMYWRRGGAHRSGKGPERDRCGVLQLCPLLPLNADAAPMIDTIMATAHAHGFEAQIGFDCHDPRLAELFVTLAYDRTIVGEDVHALRCENTIWDNLARFGSLPYRQGLQSLGTPVPGNAARLRLLARLDEALDPQRIISRRRTD